MFKQNIKDKIIFIYGTEQADSVTEQILNLVDRWRPHCSPKQLWVDEKTSYLITYGDSFKAPNESHLATMKRFVDGYLKEVISDVHILPMFPYTSDDGFSVVDYRTVDPLLGDWMELNALSENVDLMYDCVINHISSQSDWFKGWLAGDKRYDNYFINADPSLDYSSVIRPRTLPLLTPFTKANGEQVNVWTTFSADQIDINFSNPAILLESIDILLMYAVNGGRSIRLDAIGFIWKVLGSGCIHLPEAHAIIEIWRLIFDELVPGTLLITETNVPHAENISYFGQGDEAHMVYQFPLPPLTLHAFLRQDSRVLTSWAKGLSEDATTAQARGLKTTYFNFLASHDGIGVRPTEGILDDAERRFIATEVERKGGRVNYKTNTDGSTSPYELNINYLSALTEADECVEEKTKKFVAAQSILLSFVGTPAIYYHSLLGSENDIVGMESSGINRRINREKCQLSEIETALADPSTLRAQVFTEMTRLLKVRREQKAFSPGSSQQVLDLGDSLFGLVRGEETEQITYILNLSAKAESIVLPHNGIDLVSGTSMSDTIGLEPYQFIWLKKV